MIIDANQKLDESYRPFYVRSKKLGRKSQNKSPPSDSIGNDTVLYVSVQVA